MAGTRSDSGFDWPALMAGRMQGLEPCQTNVASERARRTSAPDMIDLSIGDLAFRAPPLVDAAAIQAITDGATHYTSIAGQQTLRRAVAEALRRQNGLTYQDDEVIIGNGAGQLIFAALFSTINSGDEVIIPVPYWDNYPDMVRMAQGVPVLVATDPGHRLDFEAIRRAISPRTKWIILNNPANPAGTITDAHTLERLAGLLRAPNAHGVAVLADQCFEQLCFDQDPPVSFAALPGMFDRTLTVNGLSKPYAMTGWRIGYAAGPVPLIRQMELVAANTTFSVCSVAQAAAIAALAPESQASTQLLLTYLRASRGEACRILAGVPGIRFQVPEAGYFLFIDCEQLIGSACPDTGGTIRTGADICRYLFDMAHVATVCGSAFGCSRFIRISFAAPAERVREACDRVASALRALVRPTASEDLCPIPRSPLHVAGPAHLWAFLGEA